MCTQHRLSHGKTTKTVVAGKILADIRQTKHRI